MKLFSTVLTVVAAMVVGVSAFAADDGNKNAGDKKPTAKEAEILSADKLLDKLSSSDKGKLTRLINSGSEKELIALPGIGKVTAGLVIDARPLESTAHLVTVKNVGLKTIEQIVAFVDDGRLTVAAAESETKAAPKAKSSKTKSTSSKSKSKSKSKS